MLSAPTKTKNQGFSLIELLLVLGVLAILLVAAFVVYPQTRDRNWVNQELTNISTIRAGIDQMYGGRSPHYGGLGTPIINQARIFPASMNGGDYSSTAIISSAWGGTVLVGNTWNGAPIAPTSAAGRRYGIHYSNVPARLCMAMATGVEAQGYGTRPQIRIGGEYVFPTGTNERNPAMDLEHVSQLCSASDPINMDFHFQ